MKPWIYGGNSRKLISGINKQFWPKAFFSCCSKLLSISSLERLIICTTVP